MKLRMMARAAGAAALLLAGLASTAAPAAAQAQRPAQPVVTPVQFTMPLTVQVVVNGDTAHPLEAANWPVTIKADSGTPQPVTIDAHGKGTASATGNRFVVTILDLFLSDVPTWTCAGGLGASGNFFLIDEVTPTTLACTVTLPLTTQSVTINKALHVQGGDQAVDVTVGVVPSSAAVGDFVPLVDGTTIANRTFALGSDGSEKIGVPVTTNATTWTVSESTPAGTTLTDASCAQQAVEQTIPTGTAGPGVNPTPASNPTFSVSPAEQLITTCSLVNTVNDGTLNLAKKLGDVSVVWPFQVTILGDTGATFDDESTTMNVETGTPTESGDPVPATLHVTNLPLAGVDVRVTEALVASSQFNSAGCYYGKGILQTTDYADDTSVGFVVHVAPDGTTAQTGCTVYNDEVDSIDITKNVDGAGPAAGVHVVVIPDDVHVKLGVGDAFVTGNVFTTNADGPTVVNVIQPTGSEQNAHVFVGEVLDSPTTFTGISCDDGEDSFTPNPDNPLTHRLVDGKDAIGFYVNVVNAVAPDSISCAIDDVSSALAATKTASASTVTPGDSFDWTITAKNTGPSTINDVTVADDLPASVVPTAVSPSSSCTLTGQHVACSLGALTAGGSTAVKVSVTSSTGLTDGTSIDNTATVTATGPLWDPALTPGIVEWVPPCVTTTFVPCPLPQVARATSLTTAAPTFTLTAIARASVKVALPATTTTSTTTTTTTAPTTTTTAPTTTATVAVQQEAPTTTTTTVAPTVAPAEILPRTGSDMDVLPVAAWSTAAGAALLLVRRTRRTRHS